MAIAERKHRIPPFWQFLRFGVAAAHLLQQAGRYHGLSARAIEPPGTHVSPARQICVCSAQEQEPEHP